jgi:two-component system, chemotaxis family, chemotaxis protein CheY
VKILVVDDDLDLCKLLSRYLEKHGFAVYSAGDAMQALDVLSREEIGLVITDMMMPHLDGIGFTELLRQDPRYKGTPVIMLTAYPTAEVIERGLRKGVAMTLAKPIHFDQLLALVRFAQ